MLHDILRPRRGLAGAAQWLTLAFLLLWLLRLLHGWPGAFFGVLQWMVALTLLGLAIPLLVRLVQRRMLWSLSNRLILTYLLIGLAPFVLFLTLVLISAYIAAGQFSIHLASTRLQAELNQMAVDNGHLTSFATTRYANGKLDPFPATINSMDRFTGASVPRLREQRQTIEFLSGTPVPPTAISSGTPLGLPTWAAHLPSAEFQGLVLDSSDLYLVAINQRALPDGALLTVITSLPVDTSVLNVLSEDLGHATLYPQPTSASVPDPATPGTAPPPSRRRYTGVRSIAGGTLSAPASFADIQVRFFSTLPIVDWESGNPDNITIAVESRPSLLYRALFGASLGGVITSVIRVSLILLCLFFAFIEILALRMAIGLNDTITTSVADLYHATQQIDRGELQHRIAITRDDQLAELSRSFNRMATSLERLLLEQQEKERLQNELSIAHEVQANLFPHRQTDLASLQLHGVCRPARSVSGDYYDFLVFHKQETDGIGPPLRRQTGVGIALGDISGKGISAALLMATLHSAVRAYCFASEELTYSDTALDGLLADRELHGDSDDLFTSPGRILSMLNRHLFRSTQPEKYATLFLAHYDVDTSHLTYSNAGQLPPLVLGTDGSIRRLDKGGTVVGLMDGMQYEEDSFPLHPGDILVAYSDGVTEPENDFGDFGEDRLMEVVARYRNEPLHIISSQVMQALDAWIGPAEQPDDITLVLARHL